METESLVTPVSLPSSALAPSPGPHGHGASPNVGPAGAVVSVTAVVLSVLPPVPTGAAVVTGAAVLEGVA